MAEKAANLLRRGAKALLQAAGMVLFPPVCCGCGRRIDQIGTVCPQCWSEIQFVTGPYCPIMGVPFRFDVGDGFLCGEALRDPPPFDCARAAVLHKGLAQLMVSRLKYSRRLELAPIMGQWLLRAGRDLLAQCDYIVPLPLHRRRFWQRGYNQSAELARYLARATAREFAPHILRRQKYTVPQVGLSAAERVKNMRGVFAVEKAARPLLKGKIVVLVDDVYTTGATARAAARILRRAGTAKIFVLTFSRAVKKEEF